MITEEYGKVGSKGELYPSAKIRKQLNLRPNMRVKYRISPKGYLIIEPVLSIEELFNRPPVAEVSFKEIESLSEKMQEQGYADDD